MYTHASATGSMKGHGLLPSTGSKESSQGDRKEAQHWGLACTAGAGTGTGSDRPSLEPVPCICFKNGSTQIHTLASISHKLALQLGLRGAVSLCRLHLGKRGQQGVDSK